MKSIPICTVLSDFNTLQFLFNETKTRSCMQNLIQIIAHVSVNIFFYSAMLLPHVSAPIRHLHGGHLKRIYTIHTINRRQDYSIGHILRRNCFLKQVIEGRTEGSIEVMGRRGRRIKQLLDDLNPLKPGLNPICYLLALLGAHHFLHVSRIRVKLLTFKPLAC